MCCQVRQTRRSPPLPTTSLPWVSNKNHDREPGAWELNSHIQISHYQFPKLNLRFPHLLFWKKSLFTQKGFSLLKKYAFSVCLAGQKVKVFFFKDDADAHVCFLFGSFTMMLHTYMHTLISHDRQTNISKCLCFCLSVHKHWKPRSFPKVSFHWP